MMEGQDTYTVFRAFADSWVLLAMFLFFIGVVVWAFRPGSSRIYKDTANIPFRHEDKPAGDGDTPGAH
jgi:cytochrome c oxidase cbb3-type subunit IV